LIFEFYSLHKLEIYFHITRSTVMAIDPTSSTCLASFSMRRWRLHTIQSCLCSNYLPSLCSWLSPKQLSSALSSAFHYRFYNFSLPLIIFKIVKLTKIFQRYRSQIGGKCGTPCYEGKELWNIISGGMVLNLTDNREGMTTRYSIFLEVSTATPLPSKVS